MSHDTSIDISVIWHVTWHHDVAFSARWRYNLLVYIIPWGKCISSAASHSDVLVNRKSIDCKSLWDVADDLCDLMQATEPLVYCKICWLLWVQESSILPISIACGPAARLWTHKCILFIKAKLLFVHFCFSLQTVAMGTRMCVLCCLLARNFSWSQF